MQQPRPVRTSIIGERAPIFRGAGVAIAVVGVPTGLSALLVAHAGRETRGRSLREPEAGV